MIDWDKQILTSWNPNNKNHYEALGYNFTKYHDKFFVPIKDLPKHTATQIPIICDRCQKEFYASINSVSRKINNGKDVFCKDCTKEITIALTLPDRQEKMFQSITHFCNEKGYTLLTKKSELINNNSPVRYMCPLHGEMATTVTRMQQRKGCPRCAPIIALKKKSITTLEARRDNLYNKASAVAKANGYTIKTKKEEIFKNTDRIVYVCQKHGEHEMRIANFISGKKCPDCIYEIASEKYRLSSDDVYNRADQCGCKILNIEDYKNNQTKNLRVNCPECGKEFVTSLGSLTQRGGQVCHECACLESRGERKIRYFLESNHIRYVQENVFDGCRDQRLLPFDFYLPDYNACIEFDGSQHFYEKEGFSNSLDYTQKHDAIKSKYCLENNIRLIRIPYWKYEKVDQILSEELLFTEDIV